MVWYNVKRVFTSKHDTHSWAWIHISSASASDIHLLALGGNSYFSVAQFKYHKGFLMTSINLSTAIIPKPYTWAEWASAQAFLFFTSFLAFFLSAPSVTRQFSHDMPCRDLQWAKLKARTHILPPDVWLFHYCAAVCWAHARLQHPGHTWPRTESSFHPAQEGLVHARAAHGQRLERPQKMWIQK